MKISELIEALNDSTDVTIITSIEGHVLIYQNDSFNIDVFNRKYLPIYERNNKSFIDLFPGVCKKIEENNIKNILSLLFTGMLIIYEKKTDSYFMLELISRTVRQTSDSLQEPEAITGSRDGFVENIKYNITIVRQRVKDSDLHIDELILGRKSKTKINVLSLKNITNKGFIKQTLHYLNKIDTDAILTIEDITTVFQDGCIMPQYLYVGAPDIASRRLLDGEILIFADNIPSAICLPNTISSFLRNRVEHVNLLFYSTFERIFLYLSVFLSVFFLPILTCFLTFQSDSLSLLTLSTVKVSQEGVFLPIYLQVFLVLFLFELYYIVSFKSPKLTLSSMVVLVGGIIIGQNTVESGMVDVFIITIVALCFLATFTISSNSTFVMSLSLIRIMLLISTLFLGLFGLSIASFYVVCKIADESKFHSDFLYPFIPFSKKGIKKAVLYDSSFELKTRPAPLKTITKRRKR